MNEKVTNIQVCLLYAGAVISYNLMDMAKIMLDNCPTGGWFSITLVAIISGSFFKYICYIPYKYENQNISEYINKLLNKPLAILFVLIYLGVYMFALSSTIRITCELTKNILLPNTPKYFTALCMYLLIFFAIKKGLPTILRLSQIYGILGMIIIFLICVILSSKVDITRLKPWFVLSQFPLYMKGIYVIFSKFVGPDMIFLVKLNKKDNKNLPKHLVITISILLLIYLSLSQICIAVIGPESVILYRNVFFTVARRVALYNMDFLKRLDGMFSFGWLIIIFVSLIIYGYASTFYANILLPKFKMTNLSLGILTISFILAFIPNDLGVISHLTTLMSPFYMFVCTIAPVMLGFIARRKKEKKVS